MLIEKKVHLILMSILLLLVLIGPASMMKLKMVLVAILMIICAYYFVKKRYEILISKKVFWWFIIYILSGVIWTCISLYHGNSGATNFVGIFLISPIIFMIFTLAISNTRYFQVINKVMIITTICIVIYNILYTGVINIFPNLIGVPIPFIKENVGGINLGFIKFTAENITCLTFLIPYVITLYFLTKDEKDKKIYFIIAVLGIVNALLCARTSFMLTIAITPVLIIFVAYVTRINKTYFNIKEMIKTVAICIGVVLLICLIFRIDLSLIWDKIEHSFNISNSSINSDNGGYIRAQQFCDLIDTWKIKPILGWGDAANALNVVRSDTEGLYELSYVALLMQRGLIGILIYITQIIWVYKENIKIIRENESLSKIACSAIVGYTAILLANATNPYLYNFDRLFIFFYPLMIIAQNDIDKNDRGSCYGWNNISWRFRNKTLSSNKSNVKTNGTNI